MEEILGAEIHDETDEAAEITDGRNRIVDFARMKMVNTKQHADTGNDSEQFALHHPYKLRQSDARRGVGSRLRVRQSSVGLRPSAGALGDRFSRVSKDGPPFGANHEIQEADLAQKRKSTNPTIIGSSRSLPGDTSNKGTEFPDV